ncbi:hypothetical protein SAMN05421774_11811 [Gemmobacter megaterium]|uniref:Uncharacterized protein n=3 Tax=Gemmobacter megaterium TaxID=1086013 RepID=A0A1N7QQ95_9RHOB|nr:hypothetical protein GCM10011345_38020 [Gemmobacter megaterium]SIT24677.1 hypothetical protein SAMN05421774_11811 [Gemmobacter megaterium]
MGRICIAKSETPDQSEAKQTESAEMSFDLAMIETQLDLLEWRDVQLEAITQQLEDAFPSLINSIEEHVERLSIGKVAWFHANPNSLATEVIAPWADNQARIALARAEESLSDIVRDMHANDKASDHLGAALPALAGISAIAASVAALPAVVSFATLTSTSFFFITTSWISLPLLLTGGAVLTGLSLAGMKTLGHAGSKTRAHLVRRVAAIAQTAVFGYGLPPDARCLINVLQAAVLKAGENKLSKGH